MATDLNCSSGYLELKEEDKFWVKCVTSNLVVISSTNLLGVKLVGSLEDALVSYVAVNSNSSLTQCDYGWISSDIYCYYFETESVAWEDAERACQSQGGHLASIGSLQVQMLLEEIIKASLMNINEVSVWTGGNDRDYENCFEWTDSRPFSFTYWFRGWPNSNFYNAQPSDDGLANQDCIEMRRDFRFATKGLGFTQHFYWNDRDCRVANPYICEKQRTEVILDPYPPECNRSIHLNSDHLKETLTSPSYPDPYPHNVDCYNVIHAPINYKIILTFTSFILEEEPECRYDYLEISEPSSTPQRHCGDWSSRLKLLRFVTEGSVVQVNFKSDYSHSFSGFKIEAALDQGNDQCDDSRLQPFGNNCYLFVSFPEVTWFTAKKICREIQAQLTSVESESEQNFIIERIQKMDTYTTGTLFWLGGHKQHGTWHWVDGSNFNYTDWYPGWITKDKIDGRATHQRQANDDSCLASQWKSVKNSSGRLRMSGLYWESQACEQSGGYICKKQRITSTSNMNKTVQGVKGNLTSPNYPSLYPNNLDYIHHVIAPLGTRIVVKFNHLDLEWQEDCLYDYIGLTSNPQQPMVRVCGQHSTDLERFDFVTEGNELFAKVHSDYSIVGRGFEFWWSAVNVLACPLLLTNVESGKLQSVGYPSEYISKLDCQTEIIAEENLRILVEFVYFDVGSATGNNCYDDYVGVTVDDGKKITLCGNLNENLHNLKFISFSNKIKLDFHSDDKIVHTGYEATFKTVKKFNELRVIYLDVNTTGFFSSLNYPLETPPEVNLLSKLVVPLGYTITLHLSQVKLIEHSNTSCANGVVVVQDPFQTPSNPRRMCLMLNDPLGDEISLSSTFNNFYVTQVSGTREMASFLIRYSVTIDPEYINKSLVLVDFSANHFCNPNPCQNGGKCITKNGKPMCQCLGYYTGFFCHLTHCNPNPCIFGTCKLTTSNFTCVCDKSHGGPLCNKFLGACASKPCGDRGQCVEIKDNINSTNTNTTKSDFICHCFIWWEGSHCERRTFKIPYKPLSKRMLEEPFWLGLITVSIVMAVLGCIWCIKRKFADKFERFLAEEIERNQQRNHSSSLNKLNKLAASREQISAVVTSPQPSGRSLLSRLGRRKHSMLNLDVGSRSRRYHENRSFSFDDLLRKGSPKRRTHAVLSGGNGGPEDATKEILQSLVSPVPKLHRRMSLEEFIQLSEQKMKAVQELNHSAQTLNKNTEETSFTKLLPKPPKVLKKKVSFAKCVESAAEALANQTSDAETFGSTSSVSQNIKSDTDDATSGDDISFEVPSFVSTSSSSSCSSTSSSSSSSESPTRGGLQGLHDVHSSSPVVIVHQPPPDSPIRELSASDDIDIGNSKLEEVKVISNLDDDITKSPSKVKDPGGSDSTVFRCLESLTPESNTKARLESPLMLKTPEINLDDSSKVHAIDDLAEAMEKKKLDDVMSPHRLQIPIYSMYDAVRPYRKRSLDGAMLRVPDNLPRRLSVDAAMINPAKSPFGMSMHHPLMKSPTNLRKPHQHVIASGYYGETDSTKFKPKPPPLQIPKLIQMESPRRAKLNISDKPSSLDLQAPIITITTSNMSSCDSDTDSPIKVVTGGQYLSPYVFTGPTDDMNTSLSNLSSGYSSMTSPVPSRCNSNNPLFPPSENEQDPPTPRLAGFKSFTKAGFLCPPTGNLHQPRNPYLWVDRSSSASSREVSPPSGKSSPCNRTSSETADDAVDESAEDEGIGMDQQAVENNENPVKDSSRVNSISPVIIVQPDGDLFWQNLRRPSFERTLSPVSSRSESPVSERGEHFSPQFYNTDNLAPPIFTDSDCPSSEVPASALKPPSKRQGRRKERPQTSKRKVASSSSQPSKIERDRNLKRVSPKKRTKGVSVDASTSSSSESSSPKAQDALLGRDHLPESSSHSVHGSRKRYPLSRAEALHSTRKNRKSLSVADIPSEGSDSESDVIPSNDVYSRDASGSSVSSRSKLKSRKSPSREELTEIDNDDKNNASSTKTTSTDADSDED